jgi:hypothetical protein
VLLPAQSFRGRPRARRRRRRMCAMATTAPAGSALRAAPAGSVSTTPDHCDTDKEGHHCSQRQQDLDHGAVKRRGLLSTCRGARARRQFDAGGSPTDRVSPPPHTTASSSGTGLRLVQSRQNGCATTLHARLTQSQTPSSIGCGGMNSHTLQWPHAHTNTTCSTK